MANEQEIKEAQTEVLLAASGLSSFMDMRNLLDNRFPKTVFTPEQEIDLWNTVPKH